MVAAVHPLSPVSQGDPTESARDYGGYGGQGLGVWVFILFIILFCLGQSHAAQVILRLLKS